MQKVWPGILTQSSGSKRGAHCPARAWPDGQSSSDTRPGGGGFAGRGLFGARMLTLPNPVLQALPATPNGWILDEKDKSLENRLMVIMGCNRTGSLRIIHRL